MTTTDPTPQAPPSLETLAAALRPREKTALALALMEGVLTTAMEAALAAVEARRTENHTRETEKTP
jgi:hypothetical protein